MKNLLQNIGILMLVLCTGIFSQVDSLIVLKQEVNLFDNQNITKNSSDEIKALHKKMLDDGFLIVEYIRKDWNGLDWINSQKEIYTYNDNEDLIERLTQLWNNNLWEDFSREIFSYLANNLPNGVTISHWFDDIQWYDDWRVVLFYAPSVRSLAINSSGDVFAGTNGGGTFLSTDNGTEWTQISNGSQNFYTANSLAINSIGYIFAGTEVGVFLSTNNGTDWTQINTGLIDVQNVWSLAINSDDYIFAGTNKGAFISTDNGTSWTQISNSLENFSNTYSLAINSSDNVFAATSSGVFISTDNGSDWVQFYNELTGTHVSSLAINSSGDVFAATAGTSGSGVFISTENGSNWTQINNWLTNEYINSLAINSSGDVFAATAGGGIFLSKNDVETWTQINSGLTNKCINSLAINSSGDVFAATAGGGIFLLTNNEVTWTQINSGLTNTHGNLMTGRLTQDWRDPQWFDLALETYYYDSNNNLILKIYGVKATSGQCLLRYGDNNNLIEERYQVTGFGGWRDTELNTYSYDDQNNLTRKLMQGWDTQISSWVDYIKTDFTYDSENNLTMEIYQFMNDSDWENYSMRTQEFDENNNLTEKLLQKWQEDWVNYRRFVYSYSEAPLNGFYKVSSNLIGEVEQQWNGSDWINLQQQTYAYVPTSLEETKEGLVTYTLYQNYPNPFNPTTTIKYSIPNVETHGHASVQIKIYDVLGREIATLVNKQQKPGYYEVNWNADNHSSGVYFYRIRSGDFVETKKMILLR